MHCLVSSCICGKLSSSTYIRDLVVPILYRILLMVRSIMQKVVPIIHVHITQPLVKKRPTSHNSHSVIGSLSSHTIPKV